MLGILAQSYMVATRTDCVRVRDLPPKPNQKAKRRWLPAGHWWRRPSRCLDLDKI